MDSRARAGRLREAQEERSPLLMEHVAVGRGIDAAFLTAMEEELDVVQPGHLQGVLDHDPPLPLLEGDAAPMHHRIGEAQIARMPALEEVALGRRTPGAAARARLPE